MTGEEFAGVWRTRAQRYGPAMRNELRLIGQRAVQLSRANMEEMVYSKPVDTRPRSGKPKWVRTRALYDGEVLEEEQADVFVIDNQVAYAEPRHEANKPGRRQINPARTAHWRDAMIGELREEMPERLHRVQLAILSGLAEP